MKPELTSGPSLTPSRAREGLGPLGRLMFDTEVRSIWERDTETLPKVFADLRRRYRDFARAHLAPHALAADRDPDSADIRRLFLESARLGFQTEFMPPPRGTLKVFAAARSLLMPSVLKAEEFGAACAGLGLSLLAHDLGTGPLFISGDPRAYF